MLSEKEISVKIPEKVFFSNDPDHNIVKNDFHFTIFKTQSTNGDKKKAERKSGELYPKIYIKGIEKLFAVGAAQENQTKSFLKMLHVSGNDEWSIVWDNFRDTEEKCAVIITTALSLDQNFCIEFQLSDKCSFTNIPDVADSIVLDVYVDDFDEFFSDVPQRENYHITLQRGFAVYIQKFGAYPTEQSTFPVNEIYKGDFCYISWEIAQNERAAAFLYDQNGAIVANLPPYKVQINNDMKFTLVAYNDFCSVSQSIMIYRTLWKRKKDVPTGLPRTDTKGQLKFYKSDGGTYYLYIHPKLYESKDLKTWREYSINTEPPVDYRFYSSSFSENKFMVCYIGVNLTYCEMSFSTKKWIKYEISVKANFAYALYSGQKTMVVLCQGSVTGMYDLLHGSLINGRYMQLTKGADITAADVLSCNGQNCIALLSSKRRAYFYNIEDDYRNNVFECPNVSADEIYLLKSNAVYLVLPGYVYEVNDREKFTDVHFYPNSDTGTRPVLGCRDTETITGLFQEKQSINQWEYEF